MGEEIGSGSVFKASLAAFGEGRAESAGYDDIGRGLGKDGFSTARNIDFRGGEVGCDLGETLSCWPGLASRIRGLRVGRGI